MLQEIFVSTAGKRKKRRRQIVQVILNQLDSSNSENSKVDGSFCFQKMGN